MAENNKNEDIEFVDVNLDSFDREFTDNDFIVGTIPTKEEEPEKIIEEPVPLKKKVIKEIFCYVIIIATAYLVAVAVNKFVLINAYVPSSSMERVISPGDKIIGNRLAFLFKEPQRGDVVIFKFPDNEEELYIKRIIGTPGDKVQIVDGELFINDEKIIEDYLYEPMVGNYGPYYVPDNSYFMLGDNRNISGDARFWKNTFVSRNKILAKAWFRYKPKFSKIK